VIPAASVFLRRLRVTLQEEILCTLEDPQARAAAASMLQVLAQLEMTCDWDARPLKERLRARQVAMQSIPLPDTAIAPQPTAASSASELEEAIDACDHFVQELITRASSTALDRGSSFSRSVLAYGAAAARVDLQFMRPSRLGKLTHKKPPSAQAAPSSMGD
jgi:hypothetical protein